MRMDDLISREALLAEIEHDIENSGCVNHERDMMDSIRYAPAIDAVPVVRCGECALSRAGGYDGAPDLSGMPGEVWCDHWDTVCGKAFYCAAGRWKEASHD